MSGLEVLALFGSAGAGAALGVVLQSYYSKAKPMVLIKSCELSSRLLSRVDYATMPDDIAKKFHSFRWRTFTKDEFIPSDTSTLPLSVAQETLYFVDEFLPKASEALATLTEARKRFTQGGAAEKRDAIAEIMHRTILHRLILGKTSRNDFSVFAQQDATDYSKPPVLPWAVDDAGGPGKGTYGAYTIHFGSARANFAFSWADEQSRMKRISYILADCDQARVPTIIDETETELKEDRQIATDLQNWFRANNDLSSTLMLTVSLTNLGQKPVLLSREGTVSVPLPGKEPIPIECQSESYSADTEATTATRRTVEALERISEAVDAAIPIRTRVPSDKILVQGNSGSTVVFRSLRTFSDMPEGKQLLSLYASREIDAYFEVCCERGDGKPVAVKSDPFTFGSSIPSL